MTTNSKFNLLPVSLLSMMQSGYFRNVLILMIGTGFSQLIPVIVMPFLTRVYTPEQFGLFALYLGCVNVGVAVVSGKLEVALILPRKDSDAIHLLAISCFFSCLLCIVFFLCIFFFIEPKSWIYYLPLGIFFSSIYNIFLCWFNRMKKYKEISKSRIVQSSSVSTTQVFMGAFFFVNTGLIVADVLGKLISLMCIYKSIPFSLRAVFYQINRKIALTKRYIKFVKFTLLASLANILAFQLPYILIPLYFSSKLAGFYFLVFRVLMYPISLIGLAVLDVFKNNALNEIRLHGHCKDSFLKTFFLLLLVGIIPTCILLLWGKEFFVLFFGIEWKEAGLYAQIMAPMAFLRLLSAPLSYVFILKEKLLLDLLLQVGFLVMTCCSLYMGYYYSNAHLMVILLTLSGSIFYLIQIIYSYKLSSINVQ